MRQLISRARVVPLVAALLVGAGAAGAQTPPSAPARDTSFTIDARHALHALMTVGDQHLQALSGALTLVAATEEVRSGEWDRIAPLLGAVARSTVPAVHWFALPDGRYWTLERGLQNASLADRPYFPRVLAGSTVVGTLVVSRSSHRNTAIVAVPVRAGDGTVRGVLGSSVHLDTLSTLLRAAMGGLPPELFFFAIDAEPLGAVHSDSSLIFTEPMALGDDEMRRAFATILAGDHGVVHYTFRGERRTVLHRRSAVTGWWYGFGLIER